MFAYVYYWAKNVQRFNSLIQPTTHSSAHKFAAVVYMWSCAAQECVQCCSGECMSLKPADYTIDTTVTGQSRLQSTNVNLLYCFIQLGNMYSWPERWDLSQVASSLKILKRAIAHSKTLFKQVSVFNQFPKHKPQEVTTSRAQEAQSQTTLRGKGNLYNVNFSE